MGIAGHTPNFTAAGTILPFSCVKAGTTDPFRVQVATLEDEVVLGITDGSTRAFDSTNHAVAGDPVVLQNSEFVQLRAGGTIAVGDGLRPTTNGAVIVASDRIQFVACDSAVSGEIFWAQRVGAVENTLAGAGIYGSERAAIFIRDAVNGTDSIDVITFGDSNAGSGALYGYTGGWMAALSNFGVQQYATPMYPLGDTAGSNSRAHGMFGPFSRGTWIGNNLVLNIGTIYTLSAQAGSDTDAAALYALAGNYTNWKPGSFAYDANFIKATTTSFTSGANGANITISAASPLAAGFGAAGVSLQYRVVYGKFATTGGQFKLGVYKNVNTVVQLGSYVPTSGGVGYDTATLNFTSPNTGGVVDEFKCAWDGFATAAGNYAAGPIAMFWHDVIRIGVKGWGVTNLNYFGGATTTNLATYITQTNKLLEMALKEARERQIAAGGSGRVLWFHNSGINGPDTSSTWITGAETIRNTVVQAWSNLGYPARDLAFIFSVTHPVITGDPGAGAWGADRAAVSTAANAWALNSTNQGNNVCVVDIEAIFTAQQLKTKCLYQQNVSNNGYASHLKEPYYTLTQTTNFASAQTLPYMQAESSNNGYLQVCAGIIRRMLQR
jgi:hypothetical protein